MSLGGERSSLFLRERGREAGRERGREGERERERERGRGRQAGGRGGLEGGAVVGSVEASVADGFGEVGDGDGEVGGFCRGVEGGAGVVATGGVVKIGNGARYAQDSVEGSRRHVEPGHPLFELFHAGFVGPGILMDQRGVHLRVAVYAGDAGISCLLHGSCRHNTASDLAARFGRLPIRHVVEVDRLYLDLQVDTVEERSGDLVHIFLHLSGHACAALGGVAVIATGTGVHRRNKHKRCGVIDSIFGTRHGDDTVFDGLSQHFQDLTREFGELVEEKDSIIG